MFPKFCFHISDNHYKYRAWKALPQMRGLKQQFGNILLVTEAEFQVLILCL